MTVMSQCVLWTDWCWSNGRPSGSSCGCRW